MQNIMKFIISVFLTALLGYAAGFYLPWWGIAITSFLVAALLQQSPGRSFLAGFLGILFLWAGLASYLDAKNQHLLSKRIAQLLFQSDSYFLLLLVTGVIGGLVSGLAALSGSFLRRLLRP